MTDTLPTVPTETIVDLGNGFMQVTRTDVEQRDDVTHSPEPTDE